MNPNDALLSLMARLEANLMNAEQALGQQAEQLKKKDAEILALNGQITELHAELAAQQKEPAGPVQTPVEPANSTIGVDVQGGAPVDINPGHLTVIGSGGGSTTGVRVGPSRDD